MIVTNPSDNHRRRSKSLVRGRYLPAGLFSLPRIVLPYLALLLALAGCTDPVARHAVLDTIFDGVPGLPTLDKLCEANMTALFNDYYEARLDEAEKGFLENTKPPESTDKSSHKPYREKNCTWCHDFSKSNLLLMPKEELCFKCHKHLTKGKFVHGPIAVGACLACHLPHESAYGPLLQMEKSKICSKCHQERRLASTMHDQIMSHQMACVDCHDAHSGDKRYFLK